VRSVETYTIQAADLYDLETFNTKVRTRKSPHRPNSSGSILLCRWNRMSPVGSLHQWWHGKGPVTGPMLKENTTRKGSFS